MYSGKNSTKRPAARPVLPWRRKIYSTGIDKSGYCSVAQWLSDEEDRLTTKTTYDSICPKAKDADEEGGDDAEEPASMGHCTHYSGMATARCRRTRRNGVGRWSGRVTIMQGGMAEQQKGTDDAMMQRLQPSQVMTRELQLTKPSGAKNGACGCAHSRWPAQPQGDEAEEWSFVPRICPCAISRSAKCPCCFSSSFLVLDKTKTAFFSLSRSVHTAALVFPCLLYTPTLNGPRYSFPLWLSRRANMFGSFLPCIMHNPWRHAGAPFGRSA